MSQADLFSSSIARNKPLPYVLLASGGAALVAWLTPTHELPWTSFHAEMAMALAATLVACWVGWRSRLRITSVPALAVLALVAALVPLLQLSFGLIVFRGDAALATLYLLGFGLALIVGCQAVAIWGLERVSAAFAWLVLAAAILSVWLALYQWQELEYMGVFAADLARGARPYANFNQPNQLATLLVLGLIAIGWLFEAARVGAVVAAALLALLGFGLAMTQSRAGYLELGVVSVFVLANYRVFNRRAGLRHLSIGIALIVAMVPTWHLASGWLGQSAERGASAMLEAGPRMVHWSSMTEAILRQPWLGTGWNQTASAQYDVAVGFAATRELLGYAHNLVVDLLVWNGLPIGLALVAALGLWFWAALRSARSPDTLLGLAGVAAVFAHAMVEYPLYYAYFLLPIAAVMGAISRACMPRSVIQVPAALFPVALGSATLILTIVASDYLGAEADLRDLRYERARIGLDRPRRELSQPLLLTQMSAFARFARTPESEGMSPAELVAMADVVRRFPSASNMVRLAAALALNERPADAVQVLRRVCKIQDARACADMQSLWRSLGQSRPALSRVQWPAE